MSAPLKRGFARIANRAVLNNFGYHDGAGQPFCYFMMDVPASMKNLEYRVYVRCIVGKSASMENVSSLEFIQRESESGFSRIWP